MTTSHKDYSGTPLPRKLGITEGFRVAVIRAPAGFVEALQPMPAGVHISTRAMAELDVAVLFVTSASDLGRRFPELVRRIVPSGRLWVAWPKKASGVRTDLTFETVQGLGLGAGLVDNKSASVTETYQGLQFVIRLKDRVAANVR